jgi:hypothetical protein
MYQSITLKAHLLRFHALAVDLIQFDQHAGSAVRGALFGALWGRFCVNQAASSCATCPLRATCPVASLVAPLRDENPRGRDIPRPFVIRPPLPAVQASNGLPMRLETGQPFTLGLTLIGSAANLLPYVVAAAQVMENLGIGRPSSTNSGRRGRFKLEAIEGVDPFGERRQRLYTRGEKQVALPGLAVTSEGVATRADALPSDRLALRFLTPTRLIAEGQLVRRPDAAVLVRRLADRLEALEREYGEPGDPGAEGEDTWRARRLMVERHAPSMRTVADETRWVDVASYSARQRRATPIGGFVGRAVFEGDLGPLRELLVWGEVLHAGKNAVKGDGLYRIEPP